MTEKMPDLASKKKYLVNRESFFEGHRSTQGYDSQASYLEENLYEDHANGIHYFSAKYGNTSADKARICLGKNWDYRQKDPNEKDPEKKQFSNDWTPPRLFFNSKIELGYCGDPFFVEYPYGKGDGLFPNYPADHPTHVKNFPGLYNPGDSVEVVNFKCNVPNRALDLENWILYVKTGVLSTSGFIYEPIILSSKTFFDHYHESVNPFTPQELEELEPAGKAFYADFNTFYNERSRTTLQQGVTYDLEKISGDNSKIQNSLPNIYGFLRLLTNQSLVQDNFFDFSKVVSYIRNFYDSTSDSVLQHLYNDVLRQYPLESLTSLYGVIGHEDMRPAPKPWPPKYTKIIEKIISLDFDKFDGTSLFSDYYNEYLHFISNDVKLNYGDLAGKSAQSKNHRIKALERKMSNVVFSPKTLKMMNKVDQYKKHFPFYAELEFTANLYTSVGDAMRQMFLTKFLSECVLSTTTPAGHVGTGYAPAAYGYSWIPAGHKNLTGGPNYASYSPEMSFIAHTSEKIYKDIYSTNLEKYSTGDIDPTALTSVDLQRVFKTWIKSESIVDPGSADGAEGAYFGSQTTTEKFYEGDLRNWMSYVRDDFGEPTNIDDDKNVIFKKLFGTAFLAKLMTIYKKHRRTYKDIIDGVPAYTEDLFYRIEKIRYDKTTGEENIVQQILIPNTSDLDIVKYVDTQLKYATYATYKYNVYVHRAVFGSEYSYHWPDQDAGTDSDEANNQPPLYAIDMSGIPHGDKADLSLENPFASVNQGSKKLGSGIFYEENKFEFGGGTNPDKIVDDTNPFIKGDLGPIAKDVVSPETNNADILFDIDYYATTVVHIRPSIKIIEDKIFSTPEIMILDRPPVVPDVNIIPYRAISNRIKILLTGATDRYRVKPIAILNTDVDEHDTIKKAQLSYDGKIEFGSDDPVKSFQIFRVEKKPTSYQEFELYEQINKQHFEEYIAPNTKYYYTFRAIDSHGHVSNPTPVYEVELIDEKGAVKPIIRLVDIEPKENKNVIKECQKYIYIKPSLRQLYFSDSPDVDGIFSTTEKKKKYKMRITSKGSGKKIDFNFSFVKKIDEEIEN